MVCLPVDGDPVVPRRKIWHGRSWHAGFWEGREPVRRAFWDRLGERGARVGAAAGCRREGAEAEEPRQWEDTAVCARQS